MAASPLARKRGASAIHAKSGIQPIMVTVITRSKSADSCVTDHSPAIAAAQATV